MAKPIYKASDGSEHSTAIMCEHREKVIKASQELEAAVRRVELLFGESAFTADGEQINVSCWRDYWCIRDTYGSVPTLFRVSFSAHRLRVEIDRGEPALVIEQYHNGTSRYERFKVCELFADERNAQAALLVKAEERLALFQEEVNQIKRKSAKKGTR